MKILSSVSFFFAVTTGNVFLTFPICGFPREVFTALYEKTIVPFRGLNSGPLDPRAWIFFISSKTTPKAVAYLHSYKEIFTKSVDDTIALPRHLHVSLGYKSKCSCPHVSPPPPSSLLFNSVMTRTFLRYTAGDSYFDLLNCIYVNNKFPPCLIYEPS